MRAAKVPAFLYLSIDLRGLLYQSSRVYQQQDTKRGLSACRSSWAFVGSHEQSLQNRNIED